MKGVFWFWVLVVMIVTSCQQSSDPVVLISTRHGDIKVMLYNSTPLHRDNFIELAEQGFYDSTLFHRVIPGFMIQGGDPDSRMAAPGQRLGMGGPGYKIDAEIGAPHIRGALAAARDGNPAKRSSGSQFYIVSGRGVTDRDLDALEQQKGIQYNDAQRQLYKELGGAPMLDQDYTVFGEVISGMEVVDAIVQESRDRSDRPVEDVRMQMQVLKK
ncbi:MAG: peptidylprolyl isomerase [Saprospiraceae bacterium]|nr:peptidylprolyl isomerase [Saprospiraceae bacterium]